MRITLPIDKNLDDFHTEVTRGLTISQVFSIVLMITTAILFTLLFHNALGLSFSMSLNISLVIGAAVGVVGIYRPDGIPLPKYIALVYKENHSKPLVYKTDVGTAPEAKTDASEYNDPIFGKLLAKINHTDEEEMDESEDEKA